MKKLFIIIMMLLLAGCGAPEDVPVSVTTPEPVPEPEPVVVTMTAVGDNLVHSPIYKQANRNAGGSGYDFTNAYINVADYINADINLINQETPLGGTELGISSYPAFNLPYELGEHIVSMGFNVINHANNHFYDAGAAGVENTMNFWKEKGIPVIGVYDDSIAYVEKNGLIFGFAAYTYGSNLGLDADSGYKLSYMKKENISSELAEIRKNCDILIASFHWGEEYNMEYTEEQREYAQLAADCNADLVIGHHPHVIQPIEEITRADGKGMPVAYSLGNFISSQDIARTMLGGMLTAEFEGIPGKAGLKSLGFVPLVTHYGQNYSENKVYLWDNYTEEKAAQHGLDGFSHDYIYGLIENTIDNKYLSVGHEFINRND